MRGLGARHRARDGGLSAGRHARAENSPGRAGPLVRVSVFRGLPGGLAFEEGPAASQSTRGTREITREKTRGRVLALIAEFPVITTGELAERIGISAKGIEWQLGKLKADGRIRRIGDDRGGHWEVVAHPDASGR